MKCGSLTNPTAVTALLVEKKLKRFDGCDESFFVLFFCSNAELPDLYEILIIITLLFAYHTASSASKMTILRGTTSQSIRSPSILTSDVALTQDLAT